MIRNSAGKGLTRRQMALAALALLDPRTLVAKIKTFSSKKHDIASYKTYQWLPPRVMARFGQLEDNHQLMAVIKESVTSGLSAKGYREVPEGGDLKVATGGFSVASSQLEGFLLQWGWDYYWGPVLTDATPVGRIDREGIFVIALIDAKTDQGVWGGLTKSLLGRPETVAKAIRKAATNVLKKLPRRKA